MKTTITTALIAVSAAALLPACTQQKSAADPPRIVRTATLRYDGAREAHRYVGTVQARYEVEHAFRVGGKVAARKVEVGQAVREGDVIAVLDESDYRLAVEAAHQQLVAAQTQARQAESDRRRLQALKSDGSVSEAEEEHADSGARRAQAAAEAETRRLELARNRLQYTVLRASRSGVVTAVRMEAGQVVAEGLPVVAIAAEGEPEIVVDVPEDQLAGFRQARFNATIAAAPGESFAVSLRELAPQAASQTRTYRARLKPATPRALPLGATATLTTERSVSASAPVAAIPAAALTQKEGRPAVWTVRQSGAEPASVQLAEVTVHTYGNDEVFVSGPAEGTVVITAGVQKMAPGLRVAVGEAPRNDTTRQAAR